MLKPRTRAFALVLAAAALGGCHKKSPPGDANVCPLRLDLQAGKSGEARIRFELIEDDTAHAVLDMRMPWQVTARGDDGSAQVQIGPPKFPGAKTPPPWPEGGVAQFQLDALDHDGRWKTSVPGDATGGANRVLQQALAVRYFSGVGIVGLPAAATTRVGESWSNDEPPQGGVHTHRQSKLLSCKGSRVRIAVNEQSTVDDSPAGERVQGEVEYELGQPLPVAGWLRIEARLADGHQRTMAYLYGGGAK